MGLVKHRQNYCRDHGDYLSVVCSVKKWNPLESDTHAAMMREEAARHKVWWALWPSRLEGEFDGQFIFECDIVDERFKRRPKRLRLIEKDERRATVLGLYRAFAEEGDDG